MITRRTKVQLLVFAISTLLGVSFVGGGTHAVACPSGATAAATRASVSPASDALAHAATVKNAHAPGLLARRGVQGVGVGATADDPSQPAVVVYVVQGIGHDPLPDELDGVPVRVERTDRFRAFGWNEPDEQRCAAAAR